MASILTDLYHLLAPQTQSEGEQLIAEQNKDPSRDVPSLENPSHYGGYLFLRFHWSPSGLKRAAPDLYHLLAPQTQSEGEQLIAEQNKDLIERIERQIALRGLFVFALPLESVRSEAGGSRGSGEASL